MENIFKERFDSLMAGLNTPLIRIVKSDIVYFEGISTGVESPLFNKLGDVARRVYQLIEFMNCKWMINDEQSTVNYIDKEMDIVGGEVNILGLSQMENGVNGKKGADLLDPYNLFDETEKSDLIHYYPFDYLESEFAVCFKGEEFLDELYFIDYSDKGVIIPLHTDGETYLMQGFNYKFFYGWQKAHFLNDAKLKHKIDHYLKELF